MFTHQVKEHLHRASGRNSSTTLHRAMTLHRRGKGRHPAGPSRAPSRMDEIAIAELLALRVGSSRVARCWLPVATTTTSPDSSAAGSGRGSTAVSSSTTPASRAGSSARGRPFSTTGRPSWTGRPRSRPTAFAPRGPDSRTRGSSLRSTATRSVAEGAGISVARRSDFDSQSQLNLCPPRVRVEHALLTVASRSGDEDGAVGYSPTPASKDTPRRADWWTPCDGDQTVAPTAAALDPRGRGEWCLLRPGASLSSARRASPRAPDRPPAAAGPARSTRPLPRRRVRRPRHDRRAGRPDRSRGDVRPVGGPGSRCRRRRTRWSDAADRVEAGPRPLQTGGGGGPDPGRPGLDGAAPAVPARLCRHRGSCRSSSAAA